MQGRIGIFQTRKCLKNGARRGHAPRRSELKKSRKDFFSNLLSLTRSDLAGNRARSNIMVEPQGATRRTWVVEYAALPPG